MELQDASFISATIISLIIFSSIFLVNLRIKPNKKPLPPGPKKLPIIGNLHNLIGPLPHRTLRNLSTKYGPLMHLKLGEVSTLVVSSPNMAREFMRTHDLCFANRPQILAVQVCDFGNLDIAFSPYGEYWKQMRKICVHELLSGNKIKSFSFIREEAAQNLVESIRYSSSLTPSRAINLSEKFLDFTTSMVCKLAFGDKVSERDTMALASALKKGNELAAGFNLADLYPSKKFLEAVTGMRAKLEKNYLILDRVLETIINSHITEGVSKENGVSEPAGTIEDLVDVLLRLQKSGSLDVPITINHIKAVTTDMFVGGTETTSTAIEWTMAELTKNPRVMNTAQAEIRQLLKGKKTFHEADIQELSYLKLVIKESLRLHPPVPLLIPRECREQCVVDGYEIDIKTRVVINAWAIGRDPEYWEDAESFVPERFIDSSVDYKGANFEFTPFGAGRRMCPGMSFGLANVEIILARLLYHFDWYLPNGMKPEDLDMSELFGATVMMKCPLSLMAIPFEPAEN